MLNEDLMANVIGGIAQQAVERIDGIRAQAGTVFSALIHSNPPLPNIPYHAELKSIFPYSECKETIEWRMESATFPRFIKMLSYPPYTMNLLRGIIFSVGGLSESLVITDRCTNNFNILTRNSEFLFLAGEAFQRFFIFLLTRDRGAGSQKFVL